MMTDPLCLWEYIIQVRQCFYEHNNCLTSLSPCVCSVSSMSAKIEAVNRRNSTFKVICTAIGGRTLTIDITGPNGAVADVKSVDVANVTGMGNDSFSAEVKVVHGKDGDSYNCIASNGVSNSS